MKEQSTTQDELRTLFSLVGGELIRRVRTCNGVRIGDAAGSLNGDGYYRVKLGGKTYLTHRLIWLYTHGVWPVNELDHINGDKQDNRIENLRDVTRSENLQNLRKPLSNNQTGVLGVGFSRGSYKARIKTDGVPTHLGSFATAALAGAAYVNAKRQHHATCTI